MSQAMSEVMLEVKNLSKSFRLRENRTDSLKASIAQFFFSKKDIVEDFHQIDPTGQVFRYPEDLKGNLHLIGLSIINVEVLDDGMSVLRSILEEWMDRLDYLIEMQDELRKA